MFILGISAFFHDSAACLLQGGRIVAAAQEERFTRCKHDARLPVRAVAWCLEHAGLEPPAIDAVVFYEKPVRKFERILETALATAPGGFRSFLAAMPGWLQHKLHVPSRIDGMLQGFTGPIFFVRHHEAHAASGFYPSPFEEAAILTVDGVGEWSTASWGVGRGAAVEVVEEMRFPHSLGLLYTAFTEYCGFRPNSGEYKLMGLAPYGRPVWVETILEKVVRLCEDGSLWIDQSLFNYCGGLRMTGGRFHRLFGRPPRRPESVIEELDIDLAASIQWVAEEAMMRMARYVQRRTGLPDLCLAGGVALNCVANGRLLRDGPFRRLWIQPAAGDAGGSLGAALLHWHRHLGHPRRPVADDSMAGSFLGPHYDDDDAARRLGSLGAVFHRLADEAAVVSVIARALAEGHIIGHFHGRAEFGPRALGNRSILADPRHPGMQRRLNAAIKFRESFRPFAPAVIADRCGQWFDLTVASPYMLLVGSVTSWQQPAEHGGATADLATRLRAVTSRLPAVTHVDGSARVQTVDDRRSPRLYAILLEFERMTGCPVLVNTSFNVRGEPIVGTPEDAYRCLMATGMDSIVIGNLIVHRREQPAWDDAAAHVRSFPLD